VRAFKATASRQCKQTHSRRAFHFHALLRGTISARFTTLSTRDEKTIHVTERLAIPQPSPHEMRRHSKTHRIPAPPWINRTNSVGRCDVRSFRIRHRIPTPSTPPPPPTSNPHLPSKHPHSTHPVPSATNSPHPLPKPHSPSSRAPQPSIPAPSV